jgi:lincosamide nucleotidyltransferase A/C/D/E
MLGGDDRASWWIRTTDRLNVVVWLLPLPRRLKVFLSQVVYRNPPMPRGRVLEILAALEASGVRPVLLGGWGIDALVGRQLRPHRDLDLLTEARQLDQASETLRRLGYSAWHRNTEPAPIGGLPVRQAEALRDPALRVVELHGADLGPLAQTTGRIGELTVSCLPAEHQLRAQVGRNWTWDRIMRRRANVEAVEAILNRGGPGGP